MNPALQTVPSPKEVVRILVKNVWRWLIPTVILGVLALAYALVRPATWEASQALMVRNEASNNEVGPGKFGHADEMKAVQQTILELAKSRGVLRAALKEVGPPDDYRKDPGAWPTAHDVAALRGRAKLAPPHGAEFGKTEVFYLTTEDHDRPRAIALSRAICDQLLARFQQLRDTKAQSMIDELVKTVELAKADLQASTERLTETEKQVGSDLAELRVLADVSTGDSAIRRMITEIRNELRQITATRQANQYLLVLLEDARDDPGRLVAMPNRLLESQPALRRLKDGLLDAQLATAELLGTRSDAHPLVRAAKGSEEEIGRHMHNELEIAVRGIRVELQLNADRQTMLTSQLARATGRLDVLAGLHATYANQVAETRNRGALLQRSEQNLSEARATHASARAASLISRIDAPEAGIYPLGPSRSMIVLIGIAGGLLTGFGVVFLTVQPAWPAQPDTAFAPPMEPPVAPAGDHRPVVKSTTPVLDPSGGLSFKRALQKIAYVSKA